jgi:glycosyltransferase involved in cell wall biosynthesis
MRKVIYAWNYNSWGGAQIHILALIKTVSRTFDVTVILPEGSDDKFLGYLQTMGVKYELFKGSFEPAPAVGIVQKIRRHIRKFRSEYAMLRAIGQHDLRDSIVHVDLLPHSSLSSLIWLSLRSHVFITSHNALPPVQNWREMLWRIKSRVISRFKNFNVFCSNEHAKQYFAKHYSPEVARRIAVTYTSINPEEIDQALTRDFDRDKHLADLGIATGAFVVLTVGNFIDRKGRWTLLDAASKVTREHPDSNIVFLWLTPALPDDTDTARVQSYGLGDRFRLVPSDSVGTNRLDVLSFFRIADTFVLPSFVEGLPIALLEAMALGLPCISTNVYAIPEALIHNRTGLLIEAGDSDSLAAAVLSMKNDPDLRQRLGREARDLVIRDFDERKVANVVLERYNQVLSANIDERS